MERISGIEVMGSLPWGSRFAMIFRDVEEYAEIAVPFLRAGLDSGEFCLWLVSSTIGVETARRLLGAPEGAPLKIVNVEEVFAQGGGFDGEGGMRRMNEFYTTRPAGCEGMRLVIDTLSMPEQYRAMQQRHVKGLSAQVAGTNSLALCAYDSRFSDIYAAADIINAHQTILVKRRGLWEKIENPVIRRTETALREYRSKYDDLMRSVRDGVVITNASGRILDANRAFQELTGYSLEELKKLTFRDLTVDPGREVAVLRPKLRATGYSGEFEKEYIRRDGERVPASLRVYAINDVRGGIAGFWAIVQDITERRRAERELKLSEEKYRELVESLNSIILRTDPDGKITFLNDFGRRFFGYDGDEIVGKSCIGTILPSHDAAGRDLDAMWREVMRAPERYALNENENMRKDGERVWVAWSNRVIRDAEGRPAGLLSAGTDLTGLRRAEKALEKERNKARRYFEVAGVMLVALEADGTVSMVNRRGCELLGGTEAEIVGKNWFATFLPARARKAHKAAFKALLEKGDRKDFDYVESPVKTLDGRERLIAWHHAVLDEGEGAPSVLSSGEDITERRKADELLLKARDFYLQMLEEFPALIWRSGADGSVEYFNRVWLEFTGRSLQQERGDGWIKGFHPDDIERCRRKFTAAFEGRKRFEVEYRLRHRDGGYRWIDSIGIPLRELDGTFSGYIGVAYDITRRKRMETALRESEEKYKSIFDRASHLMLSLDGNGIILDCNRRVEKVLGYTRGELEGKPVGKLMHPDSLEGCRAALAELAAGVRHDQGREFRMLRKDGSVIDVSINCSTQKNDREEGFRVVAIVEDITARKKSEASLRDSQHFIQQILATTPNLLYIIDLARRRPVYANRTLTHLLGYEEGEVPGLKVLALEPLMHPDDVASYAAHIKTLRSAQRGKVYEITYRVKGKDGLWHAFHCFNTLFQSTPDGKPRQIIGTAQEVTEQMRAEEDREHLQSQLIQSEKLAAVGTLANGVAHEFNNMLQIISGYVQYALKTKKPADADEALSMVLSTSDKAAKIVRDLLTFSKAEAAGKEPCFVSQLVDSVIAMTHRQMEKNSIEVTLRREGNPIVEVNPPEIQQVFLNIVLNARDAMLPGGGKLDISLRRGGEYAEVRFADTGKGISEENLKKVFDPFFTTKGPLGKSATPGTGLGLSVSYWIIKRHGGVIDVESAPGKGAAFTVRLPLKESAAPAKAVEARGEQVTAKPRPRRILIVDDEETICQVVQRHLLGQGHDVSYACTEKAFLELVRDAQFDIAFLDLVMPGTDGLKLLAQLRRLHPAVRTVLMTGKLMDAKLSDELSAEGAAALLQKPFSLKELTDVIARLG